MKCKILPIILLCKIACLSCLAMHCTTDPRQDSLGDTTHKTLQHHVQTVDSNLYEWHVANTTTNNEDHTTRQLTLNSQQGRLLTISLETTNKEDLPALLDSLFSKTKGKDTIILSERKTSVGFLIDNIILETEPKQ